MKKFFTIVLAVSVSVGSVGCATGYTGFNGISFPGYEAASVVAGNQAMIASIAGQQGWLPYGQPYGQFGNVPICRLQDLQGLSQVSQPVIVRVSKSKGHRSADIVGGAVVGAGLGGLLGGWQGAAYGGAVGTGGGLLVTNHEQELCLFLPVRAP